jgi:hypothetical protein
MVFFLRLRVAACLRRTMTLPQAASNEMATVLSSRFTEYMGSTRSAAEAPTTAGLFTTQNIAATASTSAAPDKTPRCLFNVVEKLFKLASLPNGFGTSYDRRQPEITQFCRETGENASNNLTIVDIAYSLSLNFGLK